MESGVPRDLMAMSAIESIFVIGPTRLLSFVISPPSTGVITEVFWRVEK
jgi:hypothetical protein